MFSFRTLLLLTTLSRTQGSNSLEGGFESASCTGSITNLAVLSASCGDSSCTFGSVLELSGQVTATSDWPQQADVTINPSIPHFSSSGVIPVTSTTTDDLCSSSVVALAPPAGDDSSYFCPDAGLYNFNVNWTIFGDPASWYASLYGYEMGVVLKIKDSDTGATFGECYTQVKVEAGDGSAILYFSFLGVAAIGLSWVGYTARKRYDLRSDALEESQQEMQAHYEEDLDTDFQLVMDARGRMPYQTV